MGVLMKFMLDLSMALVQSKTMSLMAKLKENLVYPYETVQA